MQRRRGILFLMAAVMLGLGAAWMAYRSDRSADPASVPTAMVVLARVDAATASTLDPLGLTTVEWPREHLPPGALASVEAASGRVARRPIAAGEPILESALFERGTEGGLGAVIEPSHRALSVKVDSVIGVAGFVKPGSRVDVLTTLRRVDQETATPYSKVILQDVRVLAVDQKMEEARDGKPELVSVVTLEVDPTQAEHLIYAAHEGRLQLALRTPGDAEMIDTQGANVADVLGDRREKPQLASAPKARVAARVGTRVQVLRGAKLETQTF
jgi:pilus assembly protein CpaB